VRGADPDTGVAWDDTLVYVDNLGLTDVNRQAIVELNARRAYPRLHRRLAAKGR
jgi:4-oxalmesaconate hydratase